MVRRNPPAPEVGRRYRAAVPDFHPGQVVTVFRSRLHDDAPGYHDTAATMVTLARAMPGFVDAKSFAADDGERVTIVTFADHDAQRAWREHPEHAEAQRRGRAEWYAEFSLQVADCVKVTSHPA